VNLKIETPQPGLIFLFFLSLAFFVFIRLVRVQIFLVLIQQLS